MSHGHACKVALDEQVGSWSATEHSPYLKRMSNPEAPRVLLLIAEGYVQNKGLHNCTHTYVMRRLTLEPW